MQKVISWNRKASSAVWLNTVEMGSTGLGFVWADQNFPNFCLCVRRQSPRTLWIGLNTQQCGTSRHRVSNWAFLQEFHCLTTPCSRHRTQQPEWLSVPSGLGFRRTKPIRASPATSAANVTSQLKCWFIGKSTEYQNLILVYKFSRNALLSSVVYCFPTPKNFSLISW